ncbi:MAG: hypothetical protein K9N35_07440 [Candidatus Marinimicrobia bacterium]|nr:hypothetical protein [Candidatus Neomarinimicrobiota bacterium]
MQTKRFFLTALLTTATLFSQSYLDIIRPFYGMSGVSGAESGILPAASTTSNAVLGNPALLSYAEKGFVALDLGYDQFAGTSVFNTDKSDQISSGGIRFNSLSYIYPVPVYRGAWVWGFNLQPVYSFSSIQEFSGLDTDPDSDLEFTYARRNRESGSLYAFTAGTSFLMSINTSLGFSVSFLNGSNSYDKIYYENDSNDFFLFTEYLDSLHFAPQYRGFSARLGLSSELSDAIRVGVSLEFPSRLSVTEASSQDIMESFDDGSDTLWQGDERSALEYVVWGPWRIGTGIGFTVDPLEVSVNYRFHSYTTSSMKSNLINSEGNSLDPIVDAQIKQSVQNVNEFSASIQWSMSPIDLTFAASLRNDQLNYRLDNIIRMDTGLAYHFSSGLGLTIAFRKEQWMSDLNHALSDNSERKIEVQNSFSKIQFGIKYYL